MSTNFWPKLVSYRGEHFSDLCAKKFQNLPGQSRKIDFFIKNKHLCATLRLNISRIKEITAKPMVLSYVGHFYKHLNKNPWSGFY